MAVVGPRALSGLTLPLWALVRRELLSQLRGTRAFFLVLLAVVAAAFFVMRMWPTGQYEFVTAGWLSRALMESLIWALFYGCLVFVPAFASGALVLEHERETYDLLRMSLIRPSGIVFAKLLNAIGFFILILVALIPFAGVGFFLVGIETTALLRATVITLTASIACATAGLLSSSIFRRSATAIGGSYVMLIGFNIAPMVIMYFYGAARYTFGFDLRAIDSTVDMVRTVTWLPITLAYTMGGVISSRSFFLALGYQLAIASCCLALVMRGLRRPAKPPKIARERPIDDAAVLAKRRTTYPYYLLDPLRRKKPIEDRRNPMTVREMRWGLFNRATTLVRVFYVFLFIYFMLGALASLDARSLSTMGNWFVAQIVLTVAVAPALVSNAVTKEYELGNLDMLRMTLLRPKDIVLGKFFAGLGSVAPLLVAAAISCAPVVVQGAGNLSIIVAGYTTLGVCTLLSISLGIFASLLSTRTSVALVLSYLLGLTAFWGLSAGAALLQAGGIVRVREETTTFLSPIVTFYRSLPTGDRRFAHVSFDFWTVNVVTFAALSVAIVWISIKVFERYKATDA